MGLIQEDCLGRYSQGRVGWGVQKIKTAKESINTSIEFMRAFLNCSLNLLPLFALLISSLNFLRIQGSITAV